MSIDTSKLPKYAQRHIAAQEGRIGELEGQLADVNAKLDAILDERADASRDDAEANSRSPGYDTKVFDRVNRRHNEHGSVLNCRIAEGCTELSLAIAARALGTTLNGRHSDVRVDRNDRRWVDFYPAVETAEELV